MPTHLNAHITYSLVLPIFNEETVLPALLVRVDTFIGRLDGNVEVIFVDDGSDDKSANIVAEKAKEDNRYRLVSLSRNFGHQIAITAGMDAASGRAVIVMDADLQDPPEVVLEMIAQWKSGFQIVYAQRRSREGESVFNAIVRPGSGQAIKLDHAPAWQRSYADDVAAVYRRSGS